MKAILLMLYALLLSLAIVARAGTVSLEPDEMVQLRAVMATNESAEVQFAKIHRMADAALNDTPHPVQKVVSEGHLATDPRKVETWQALKDMPKIEALAWTGAVESDARYAAKAREFILAWARVNQSDGDAINETDFEPLIVAYDLLRGTFSDGDRQTVDAWLHQKAEKLWRDKRGLKNNWYSHRLKIAGLISLILGDHEFYAKVIAEARRHIGSSFAADGSSLDFHQRDALHYHLYTVEPLLILAQAAARNGDDLFDYQAAGDGSIHRGVDFVVPFATGQQTHREFVNSKVGFDRARAKNGQAEYSPHLWEPKTAIGMFVEAGWFRPEYGELAKKLAGQPGVDFLNWKMVVNAVSQHASPPPVK